MEDNMKDANAINDSSDIVDDKHVCKITDSNKNYFSEEDENIISKRPWKNSAVEVEFPTPDGKTKRCWVQSVVDANGNLVCYGKTADMKFIADMGNSFDDIVEFLKSHGKSVDEFLDKFKSLIMEKKKAFKYN